MKNNLYGLLNENQLHMDKTECLEKGIVVFPSIYIEGSAACGKTTAVKMLLARHPEVKFHVFDLNREMLDCKRSCSTEFEQRDCQVITDKKQQNLTSELEQILVQMSAQKTWVIFENINHTISESVCTLIINFIRRLPENGRAILIGRTCPEEFLDLVWKREMELIEPEKLLFTRSEIREFIAKSDAFLDSDQLYEVTGGWPGCVDMMIRLSDSTSDIEELRESFEIDTYIEREIIGTLDGKEKELVELARICPWLNEALCLQVWQMKDTKEVFYRLKRKGIFHYNKLKGHYTLARLFQKKTENVSKEDWKNLAAWYEKQKNIREAYLCIKNTKDKQLYQEFLYRYYDKIPFMDVRYDEVMNWYQLRPEICYLRGMYSYYHQFFDNLQDEIERVMTWQPSTEKDIYKQKEIYLNLMYVNPEVSFAEWMQLLEKETAHGEKYRLYSLLGTGHSFLCGLRDLSGMFACSKKEESRQAKLWKESLGEQEWIGYCLARIDFYMETKQEENIQEENWNMLYLAIGKRLEDGEAERYRTLMWRFRLAGLYLLCKWPSLEGADKNPEHIYWMENILLQENADLCIRNTEAVVNLYSPWWNEPERLTRWLRYGEDTSGVQITEKNYLEIFARAKGYLMLNHYEKAEQILERLLPYLQTYHRYRYFAECLFGMAIINWSKDKKGQAYRNMMESFLVTGASRYVGFYTRYGKKGREVLEGYIEWLKNTTPDGWHRKKKYNYGNVLRMPMEDYLEVILRGAKKESKFTAELAKGKSAERLTMMETIILQDISRGLSNTEICQEQNLKLPTVKSHIYSLYKKLNVSSRVQAVNKGKEMGIVR